MSVLTIQTGRIPRKNNENVLYKMYHANWDIERQNDLALVWCGWTPVCVYCAGAPQSRMITENWNLNVGWMPVDKSVLYVS